MNQKNGYDKQDHLHYLLASKQKHAYAFRYDAPSARAMLNHLISMGGLQTSPFSTDELSELILDVCRTMDENATGKDAMDMFPKGRAL